MRLSKHSCVMLDNKYELSAHGIAEDSILGPKTVGDRTYVGYLAHDDDCRSPCEDCDGVGRILTTRRGSGDHEEIRRILEAEEPHVKLAAYIHSGEHWSIQGSVAHRCYPDQQFDVAHFAGIWVPDEACLVAAISQTAQAITGEQAIVVVQTACASCDPAWEKPWILQTTDGKRFGAWSEAAQHAQVLAMRGTDRARWSVESSRALEHTCQEILDQYNAWLAGDCWGVCVDVFDANGERIDSECDACWGYIGNKWATEELKSQFEYMTKETDEKGN